MSVQATTRFQLPEELSATEPPEARGIARDGVRLLVAEGGSVTHTRFANLATHLRPGDLVVVNTSGTVPAAIDGARMEEHGRPVTLHLSSPSPLEDGTWVVELRTPHGAAPLLDARPGDRVELPAGAAAVLLHGVAGAPGAPGPRLWRARLLLDGPVGPFLARHGRAVTYSYMRSRWPLTAYQTVFAREPGSAEMPSAGRPFSDRVVTDLGARGVALAPVLLHTGVSSLEAGEPPQPERFRVPAATAALVEHTRRRGGRVVAVGTTVTRALETVARADGSVRAGAGWTDLVLGPERPGRVVDGIITGWHTPDASHLLLLEAVVGPELVQRAYAAALREAYLWHEFGDSALLLSPGGSRGVTGAIGTGAEGHAPAA